MQPLDIIDHSQHRSITRKCLELSFTTVIWAIWGYLFMPLLTLVLWLAGIWHTHFILIEQSGLEQLLKMCTRVGWFTVCFAALLKGWQWYNHHLFRRNTRRNNTAEPMLPDQDLELHAFFRAAGFEHLHTMKEIEWTIAWDDMKELLKTELPN